MKFTQKPAANFEAAFPRAHGLIRRSDARGYGIENNEQCTERP